MRYTLDLEWPAVDLLAWALRGARRTRYPRGRGRTTATQGVAAAEGYATTSEDCEAPRRVRTELADADLTRPACSGSTPGTSSSTTVRLVTADDVRALLTDLAEAYDHLDQVVASFTSRVAGGLDADNIVATSETATTSSCSTSTSSTPSTFRTVSEITACTKRTRPFRTSAAGGRVVLTSKVCTALRRTTSTPSQRPSSYQLGEAPGRWWWSRHRTPRPGRRGRRDELRQVLRGEHPQIGEGCRAATHCPRRLTFAHRNQCRWSGPVRRRNDRRVASPRRRSCCSP